MENDELNKWIAENVMGVCVHETEWVEDENGPHFGRLECMQCHEPFVSDATSPNYCTDLNAVSKAEAKAIEKVGWEDYTYALLTVLGPDDEDEGMNIYHAATATARQRAEAIYAAFEVEK